MSTSPSSARSDHALITLAVIGDTHIPRRARSLPLRAWRLIDDADSVLHAGDVVSANFLEELARHRPVHAVRGNNDVELESLPEVWEDEIGGVAIAMLHDSGPSAGRRERLRQRFPAARVVVYGHSHIPQLEDDGHLLLLNPGSPTDRRRMPTFTMALLHIDGAAPRAEIVDLGLERGPG